MKLPIYISIIAKNLRVFYSTIEKDNTVIRHFQSQIIKSITILWSFLLINEIIILIKPQYVKPFMQ